MALQFHGFCSYPHGGWVNLCLIVCCLVAMSATIFGISSCRFAYVEYASDRGDFGIMFVDPTADGEAITRRNGVGLFTWLLPFDSEVDWTSGTCRGYSRLQLDNISDEWFEISRIFGVLSVLLGTAMSFSTLFLSCLSYNRFQIWLMSGTLLLLTAFTGLTFLFMKAFVCEDLVSGQRNASQNDPSLFVSSCTVDQGGLIIIAATVLWFVTSLISIVYIRPIERECVIVDGRIANAFEERQKARQQRYAEGHRSLVRPPRDGSQSPYRQRQSPNSLLRPEVASPDRSRSPLPALMRSTEDDEDDDYVEPPRIRPQRRQRQSTSVSVSDTDDSMAIEAQLKRLRRMAAQHNGVYGESDLESRSDSSFEV